MLCRLCCVFLFWDIKLEETRLLGGSHSCTMTVHFRVSPLTDAERRVVVSSLGGGQRRVQPIKVWQCGRGLDITSCVEIRVGRERDSSRQHVWDDRDVEKLPAAASRTQPAPERERERERESPRGHHRHCTATATGPNPNPISLMARGRHSSTWRR